MPAPGVCMSIINARQKKNGIGTISNPEKFLNQDFQQMKQYCQIKNVRYIDEMFPPDRRTIGQGVLSPEELKRVQWCRPSVSVFDCYKKVISHQNSLVQQTHGSASKFANANSKNTSLQLNPLLLTKLLFGCYCCCHCKPMLSVLMRAIWITWLIYYEWNVIMIQTKKKSL